MPKSWGRVELSYISFGPPYYLGTGKSSDDFYFIYEVAFLGAGLITPSLVSYKLASDFAFLKT